MINPFILISFFEIFFSEKIIRNINFPSCRDCVHFTPSLYDTDFISLSSKCKKFGDKNIINNKITYDYANSCRYDNSKCGEEGKYFELEKNINLKILLHKSISNIPNNILTITILLSFYVTFYKNNK